MRPLRPLGEAGFRGVQTEAARARAEAKARRAWGLCVGQALQRQTVFLRLAQGRIVLGAWNLEMIPSLRRSAESAWPRMKERLEQLTGLRFAGLEVMPSDPPEESLPEPARHRDALDEVLTRLRAGKP